MSHRTFSRAGCIASRSWSALLATTLLACGGGPSNGAPPGKDGSVEDASAADGARWDAADSNPASSCSTAADCVLPPTQPANCAEASCIGGRCLFKALDRDGDSYRARECSGPGLTIELGADCDDTSVDVAPNALEMCNSRDDDCDTDVDEEIPASSETCPVGEGVCRAEGHRTCVDGAMTGCDATPLPPQGEDAPRCDGTDYDCHDGPNTGCECHTGDVAGTCQQRCRSYTMICTNGRQPSCDPNGDDGPKRYVRDEDGDGHVAPNARVEEFCDAGETGGTVQPHSDPHWLLEGAPADDCDDSQISVSPEGADSVCDGIDQDCNGSEPAASCGRCGSVACGSSCPRCPNGWFEGGEGPCQATGTVESYFSFGDALRGDYGDGRSGGWYSVPGTYGADVGRFAVSLSIAVGASCSTGDGLVAYLRCDDPWGTRIIDRPIIEREFTHDGNWISVADTRIAGGACWYTLVDNRRYCCSGCARRFSDSTAYATSNYCT